VVLQVTEVATSKRQQFSRQRFPKVSAGQPMQDNNSSSGKTQQEDITKLRIAQSKLQEQLRKLQEQRQAEGKVSQEQAVRVRASRCAGRSMQSVLVAVGVCWSNCAPCADGNPAVYVDVPACLTRCLPSYLQVFKAQLAACEAERAQLREQMAEAADEVRMQRQKVAEQERQLGAAHDNQMVQLRELGEQASSKNEVSIGHHIVLIICESCPVGSSCSLHGACGCTWRTDYTKC
jgi:hypothetical protein